MAAKKKSGNATGPTPCQQGGGEVIVPKIQVRPTDQVELILTLCKSPFHVIAALDDHWLVDEKPVSEVPPVLVAPLDPGLHMLSWGYLAAAEDWQVKSEVAVNGLVRFRLRKSSEGTKPFNKSFVILEVV